VGRCVFLDLCAGPHAMTEDHGLFVHLNADGDVLVSRDFEALVIMKMDEFVVANAMAIVVMETKERSMLVMTERLDFGAGQLVGLEVVELAVDVNGDGGLHDASSHEAA